MVSNGYKIIATKQALKDKEKIKQFRALERNVKNLIEIIKLNPYQNPPSYEALVGNFKGLYSRRINRQHRLVYRVFEEEKIIIIISMWTHYSI